MTHDRRTDLLSGQRRHGGRTIGKTFNTRDSDVIEKFCETRKLLAEYNRSAPAERDLRHSLLDALLGTHGKDVWIEPTFHCDYGSNIHLADGVFVNANCVFLDGADISVGENTLFGPAAQVYATTHPIRPADRLFPQNGGLAYLTSAEPVTIGKQAWIGGGAIILPGVTIGDGTTIGAGSVVTKPIPENVFAAGNPCKVIRTLD